MAGRPKIEITEEVCKQAREYAKSGLSKKDIAYSLGFSYQTLNEKSKENSDFSDAIKKGQLESIRKMANAVYDTGIKGNVTAMIFYLKNRAPEEWKDRVPEGSGEAPVTPVKVEFTMIDGRKDADQSTPD